MQATLWEFKKHIQFYEPTSKIQVRRAERNTADLIYMGLVGGLLLVGWFLRT